MEWFIVRKKYIGIENTTQKKLEVESLSEKISKNLQSETISSFEDLIYLSSKKKEIEPQEKLDFIILIVGD